MKIESLQLGKVTNVHTDSDTFACRYSSSDINSNIGIKKRKVEEN